MVEIDAGNLYITTGTLNTSPATTITGGTIVQINTTEKIDYISANPVLFIPIPVSRGNRGTINPYARALDLKRITETIGVQGFLAEETDERAIDKRNNLLDMQKKEGALTIVWGLGNYQTIWTGKKIGTQNPESPSVNTGAFITRLQFTETGRPEVLGDTHSVDSSGDVAYNRRSMGVIIQLGRGKDL